MDRITVMDTTMRDGEQTPGIAFTPEEKAMLGRMLYNAGVDFIEVASAQVSGGEKSGAMAVAAEFEEHGYPADILECLTYLTKESVDWAHDTGVGGVNILAKSSVEQIEKQFRMEPKDHTNLVLDIVEYAYDLGMKVNLYLEHYSSKGGVKDNPEYVDALINELIKTKKMQRITFCDTLGLFDPDEVKRYVGEFVEKYPKAFFDFHGHNDYGMAVANTLEAVRAHCKGIQATINGLGERTGNAPLEEVIVAVHDKTDKKTNIKEYMLKELSSLVEHSSGVRIPQNKPIVGKFAFTHKSGIHVDGMSKAKLYESIDPTRFGRSHEYDLGKHSGKATIRSHLEVMGVKPTDKLVDGILMRVKEFGDMKKVLSSEDLPYIIADLMEAPEEIRIDIEDCAIVTAIGTHPVATVSIKRNGKIYKVTGSGVGGYDAFMNAVRSLYKEELPKLVDYEVTIPPGGKTDALVYTTITWEDKEGNVFKTIGVSPDQTFAAVEATKKMLNRFYRNKK